jgi:hypothetical protein
MSLQKYRITEYNEVVRRTSDLITHTLQQPIVKVIKSRRMEYGSRLVNMGKLRYTKFWPENPKERNHLGDLGGRCEANIQINL